MDPLMTPLNQEQLLASLNRIYESLDRLDTKLDDKHADIDNRLRPVEVATAKMWMMWTMLGAFGIDRIYALLTVIMAAAK